MRRVGLFGILVLAGRLGAWAPDAAQADDSDQQPEPPWVFFATPDEPTAEAVDHLIENTFADLNLVVEARAALVRRFGVWSVPRLVRELTLATHDSGVLNSALTAAALRGHLGPAPELAPLVRPLIATARAVEEWRRAAAMLALGSFQGPEGAGRPRRRADVLIPLDPVVEARRLLEGEALEVLRSGLSDQSWPVRCVAALALAKTGVPVAGGMLREASSLRDAAVEPRMAALLARGFLAVGGAHDHELFIEALADTERKVRASAALGASLQVVCDQPPAWTDAPARLRRALALAQVNTGKEDTAEAVFTRGCLAWKTQDTALWDEVLTQATSATVERGVASAGAQVLVWCDDPQVRARALALLGSSPRALHPAVLASLLLRAGYDGSPEGVRAVVPWLSSSSHTPKAEPDWDVRWHALVGLLRALSEGRIRDEATRRVALDALDDAARRGLHREAPALAALERVLAAHGAALAASPSARLPPEPLRDFELACACPHGILVGDLRAAAVQRANAMVYGVILDLADLRALSSRDKDKERDKEGTSRRFVQRYLAAWPYFERLDLLRDRGRRAPPRLLYDDPAKVLERGPK